MPTLLSVLSAISASFGGSNSAAQRDFDMLRVVSSHSKDVLFSDHRLEYSLESSNFERPAHPWERIVKTVDSNVFMQINDLLCQFFLSFDQRDWAAMTDCLAPQVAIDYSSSGRELPSTMSGHDFVRRRQKTVDNLAKHHSFSNLLIGQKSDEGVISARCNYLILRFDQSLAPAATEEGFFHSCGSYEFLLSEEFGEWKISSIKQNALRSWGNAVLHAGSAQEGKE